MLKLNASFAKKVPATEKYSSQSYLACLEVELPTGQTTQQLKQKIHDTFELVKASVEEEIAAQSSQGSPENKRPQGASQRPSRASEGLASGRQISYLLQLGKDTRMGLAELNQIASEEFKAESIYQMSKRDISQLIDRLKMKQAA